MQPVFASLHAHVGLFNSRNSATVIEKIRPNECINKSARGVLDHAGRPCRVHDIRAALLSRRQLPARQLPVFRRPGAVPAYFS